MDIAAQLGAVFLSVMKIFLIVILPAGILFGFLGLWVSNILVKKYGKSESYASTVNTFIIFFGSLLVVSIIWLLAKS